MNQFLGAIYFLPCIICLIWTFIYFFRVKTITQKLMMALLVLCVFYFTTYAFYISPLTDYEVMAQLDMFNIPVILVILAVDLVFVWTHQSRSLLDSRLHLLLYIPALVVSSVNFLIVYIVGIEDIARFDEAIYLYGGNPPGFDDPRILLYHQFNTYVVTLVILAYILVIVYSCIRLSWLNGYRLGDGYRFFFRANESMPTRVICFLNVLTLCLLVPLVRMGGLGRSYLLYHPGVGCVLTLLLSISLFCLFYVEYMIDLPRFTLSSLSHVSIGSAEQVIANAAPAVTGKATESPTGEVDDPALEANIRNDEQERVEAALRKALDEERVYIDPGLSIVGLAAQLNTNRTTLSLVISQVYGVNFRQLVGRYRVEAAKRYMLERPEAKQDEVAIECGFVTAQAFNQKFKELVGDAPRMWMVKQNKENI